MTKANMVSEAICKIEHAIWRTEHMDWKSTNQNNYWYGMAQGIIITAFDMELITEAQKNMFWNRNSDAYYAKQLKQITEGIA